MVNSSIRLRHNFAIWVIGQRPGFFKPLRYMYRCLRCRWAFDVNDEYRGSIRVAVDEAAAMTQAESDRRLASFDSGPCPGYQAAIEVVEESSRGKIIPMRRECRQAKTARNAHAT